MQRPCIRFLAEVTGTIISCMPTSKPGPLFYQALKNDLNMNKVV